MKEKDEEVRKTLTASSLINVNREKEEDRYSRQFTLSNIEDRQKQGSLNGNILKDEQDGPGEIKLTLNKELLRTCLNNIIIDNEGKHSEEWKNLYDAADKVMQFIIQKKSLDSDQGILLLLSLSEACIHYNETHIDKSGKKADGRKKNVRDIRVLLRSSFAGAAGDEADPGPVSEERVNERKKGASENVKRFSKYYTAFSKKIGKDMIGSAEEKLRRRWNALRSCEEDILIYRQTHTDDKKIDPKVLHVLNEYKNIRSQILFIDRLKKTGGHKDVFKNEIADDLLKKTYKIEGKALPADAPVSKEKDGEGLSAKQLTGLSEIDTWVMRNFNNGGYMACFGGTTDRSDIINSLFSLSRRERLYIYYLVEKRERINPSIEGFGESQTTYEPDVSAFKNQMIAIKLKFYSRFSGGYIYWNKLSQAMAIATRTRPLLQTATQNAELMSKREDVIRNDNRLTENQKEQKIHLTALYRKLQEGKKILEKLKKEKKENIKKSLKEQLDILREQAGDELTALQELDGRIEKKNLAEVRESVEGAGAKKASKKGDAKQYLSGMTGDIGGGAFKATKLVKEKVLGFNEETCKSILGVMNPANAFAGTFGGVMGFIFGVMALIDGAESMSWADFTENGLGLLSSVASTASKGANLAKVFTGEEYFLTGTEYSSALVVADLALQAVHTVSMTRDEYHRMKASQKLKKLVAAKKKKGESAEFEKNMYRLQDRISDSRAKSTFTKLALTGATVAALFVCPPVGAVIGAVQFAGGIVNRVVENRRKRSNKYYLFDKHFKIDEQADKLIKDKKVKATADKETLKNQLRRRVAASVGFASPSDAADAFAKRYAKKMIELANAGGEHGEYYVQLIKGFGLYYRYLGPGHKKNRPKEADLAKKITF